MNWIDEIEARLEDMRDGYADVIVPTDIERLIKAVRVMRDTLESMKDRCPCTEICACSTDMMYAAKEALNEVEGMK